MLIISGETGTITWGIYTIRPETTETIFRRQAASPTPTGDRAMIEENQIEKGSVLNFLARVFSRQDKQRNITVWLLPKVRVDDTFATGRLVFKDGIPHSLEIILELPDRSENERLRRYNQFLMKQLGRTGALSDDAMDRPHTHYYPWGQIRTYLRGKSKSVICEVKYRALRLPKVEQPNADVVTIVAAYKDYLQAEKSEAQEVTDSKHQRFKSLLAKAVIVPRDNFSATTGSNFYLQKQGVNRFSVLAQLHDYVQLSFERKNYEDALAAASIIIELEPDDHAAYGFRAEAYQELERYEDAIAQFTEAIQRVPPEGSVDFDPNAPKPFQPPHWHADYLWKRGYVRRLRGDLDGAIGEYTQSLTLREQAMAYRLRGVAHMQKLDFAPALVDLEAALRLEPEDVTNLYNRGVYRALSGDLDGALADMQTTYQEASKDVIVLGSLAWVHRLRGEFADAQKFAEQAMQVDSQYGSPYYSRGAARAAQGDVQGAVADFRLALERWKDVRTPLYAKFAQEMDDYIAAHSFQ